MILIGFTWLMSAIIWAHEICPIPDTTQLFPFADELQTIVDQEPEQLIPVRKVNYKKNSKLATYCTRPVEMVDTIVIHHSQTSSTATAEEINTIHLNKKLPGGDRYYMIAYEFVVNSPYAEASQPKALVSEGRPMEMVSGSQGSGAFVEMDNVQRTLWEQGAVKCGLEGKNFASSNKNIKNGKIKANITTLGIVINGNYAKYNRQTNPTGLNPPRLPTQDTLVIVAKLACQLQKQYPRIKYLKWHSFYTPTDCPGTLKEQLAKIRELAKEYKCEFI